MDLLKGHLPELEVSFLYKKTYKYTAEALAKANSLCYKINTQQMKDGKINTKTIIKPPNPRKAGADGV